MPLTAPAFYLLVALSEGDRHGYAIIKEVDELTGGEVALLPGTLYRLIKQLLTDEWIAEVSSAPDDDPRRRYYRLTQRGRKAAEAEARRLEAMVRLARQRRLLPARV
ncbi:MAG TPA: PadR family transcriptional regulator [Candidatus Baltobacteraceae bacterium]|jgi:DNA-binding PadR family transcriptional regulator|nr:PadR family transcriptional regulator [Candidatus Baltobacteraceae bacterium]